MYPFIFRLAAKDQEIFKLISVISDFLQGLLAVIILGDNLFKIL